MKFFNKFKFILKQQHDVHLTMLSTIIIITTLIILQTSSLDVQKSEV